MGMHIYIYYICKKQLIYMEKRPKRETLVCDVSLCIHTHTHAHTHKHTCIHTHIYTCYKHKETYIHGKESYERDINLWYCSPAFCLVEPCHIRMKHVVYEWVMPHINGSCYIWMSRVTHTNEPCHTHTWCPWKAAGAHLTRMSHVTCMNESHHMYKWVMSRMDESCPPHTSTVERSVWRASGLLQQTMGDPKKWDMSHMDESWHTWMSRTSRTN